MPLLERRALLDLTERLQQDHPALPAGSVMRCVWRRRGELLLLGVHGGLPADVEDMARSRLGTRW